jgi:long-subunit acyl-CoA synthetase (AMP-forming)
MFTYWFIDLHGQVGDKMAGVASAMASLGLGYKDRCGVYGANSPEWMIALQVTNLSLSNLSKVTIVQAWCAEFRGDSPK